MPTDLEHSGRGSPQALAAPGKRHFTVAQANLALVLVKRIVADVVTEYRRMLELQEALEAARFRRADEQASEIRRQLTRTVDKLRDCLEELEDVGVELKDWSLGVVDFPCLSGSRHVCLCWQFGQDHIESWHELEEEPAVRRPLDELPLLDLSANDVFGWRTA